MFSLYEMKSVNLNYEFEHPLSGCHSCHENCRQHTVELHRIVKAYSIFWTDVAWHAWNENALLKRTDNNFRPDQLSSNCVKNMSRVSKIFY